MKRNVTQHFRKEEEKFVDLCTDWVRNVELNYAPHLTYFLNPRERFILHSIVGGSEECHLSFFGGFQETERKRALLYPPYFEPEEKDYEISLCQIEYAMKFNSLTHSQILGTLLGNGLTRDVVGDIFTDGSAWQFYIEKQIATYLPMQIEKMGKTTVKIKELSLSEKIEPIDEWKEVDMLSSSLRLDTVIASLYNLSRQKTKELIEAGQVKVNWGVITRAAFEIEEEDMVSIRRLGRFQYMASEGLTKKNKEKMSIRMLKDKK